MPEMLYQRDVYGQTLLELGKAHKDIVVLDADLSGSTRTCLFAKEFKDRFFNFGVAEQNMLATAAGLASCGKVVFVSTFAMFATGRAWDQVRNSICYNNFNVKIVATHAGLSVGPDGASHQALEDIALMRVIPNIKIIVPCDGPQTKEAILAAYDNPGPFYVRLSRPKFPTIENKGQFKLGLAQRLRQGADASVFACGAMVRIALDAAEILEAEGIKVRVVNMPSLRPIDSKEIISAARETKGIVVCEEHSTIGGLASAISEIATEDCPVKLVRLGVKNRFGQSGDPEELFKEYLLTSKDIITSVKKLLKS